MVNYYLLSKFLYIFVSNDVFISKGGEKIWLGVLLSL